MRITAITAAILFSFLAVPVIGVAGERHQIQVAQGDVTCIHTEGSYVKGSPLNFVSVNATDKTCVFVRSLDTARPADMFSLPGEADLYRTETEVSLQTDGGIDSEAPNTIDEALALIPLLIEAIQSGAWVLVSLIVVQLIIFGIKRVKASWMEDHATKIILGLAATASVLALVAGGVKVQEALLIFVLNSALPLIQSLVKEFKTKKDS